MQDVFDARNIDAWVSPAPVAPVPKPDFADNDELKSAFGIALARGLNTFEAGLELFDGDVSKGLWVSTHWRNDPTVIASKDAYLKALKKAEKPLDKEELLEEILSRAKTASEDKDAVAFFKLYSEIAGYIGKQVIDASTNFTQNNTNNVMQIKLVSGSDKLDSLDAPNFNSKSKMQNDENILPKLKLVGGSR